MQTEELFSQIKDKLEGKYYDKKTFRLIKKIYKEINEPKTKKSTKVLLPFYGYIFQDKCFGIPFASTSNGQLPLIKWQVNKKGL